jgi:hypothetical protein
MSSATIKDEAAPRRMMEIQMEDATRYGFSVVISYESHSGPGLQGNPGFVENWGRSAMAVQVSPIAILIWAGNDGFRNQRLDADGFPPPLAASSEGKHLIDQIPRPLRASPDRIQIAPRSRI